MYDPKAMAGKIMLPGTLVASIVGHIPKEISRYTRYIVEHGASVDAFLLATHRRPSPQIHGGLEISIKPVMKLTYNEVSSAKLQNIVNLWMKTTESLLTESSQMTLILKLIVAQNAGPGEDDDDEGIEDESDQ